MGNSYHIYKSLLLQLIGIEFKKYFDINIFLLILSLHLHGLMHI